MSKLIKRNKKISSKLNKRISSSPSSQKPIEEKEKKEKRNKLLAYRNGGEGCCLWAEDNLCVSMYRPGTTISEWVPISEIPKQRNPITGRSPYDMWQKQKETLCRALEMKDGRFIYRLIVLCWMRGESKSFLACLIQLWKFMCWPKQTIVLGANSKDQVKFVHFDIIRDMALNSPNIINIIGQKNVQEKEIRLKNKNNAVVSFLRPISSFSGIVSNITGYTFSEIFDMKRPKFFEQLHGSIRNIPNALGTIDSTVSDKTHILYKLYKTYVTQKDPTLFFYHRESPDALQDDYWNPEMTQQQLDSYKGTLNNFDQYFKNTWDAGSVKPLTEEMLDACAYIGYDDQVIFNNNIINVCQERNEYQKRSAKALETYRFNMDKASKMREFYDNKAKEIHQRLKKFPELEGNQLMHIDMIEKIADIYNTDLCILAGLDRADPLKTDVYSGARTMLSFIAKGLPDSRSLHQNIYDDEYLPKYLYFPIGLFQITDNTLESIKAVLNQVHLEIGIDSFCSERWGVWDMVDWFEANDIAYEILHPTYEKQRAAFSALFETISNARFKVNVHGLKGYKEDCQFKEEGLHFVHHKQKRQYVSDEKDQVNGVQDDLLYSIGWGLYGGRNLGVPDFRSLNRKLFFGAFVEPDGEVINY
ncbi:MAG: hypothetical protein ACOCZ4_00420 [Bacteroidota bacterium]